MKRRIRTSVLLLAILAAILVGGGVTYGDDTTDGCTYVWEMGRWLQEYGPELYVIGLVCEDEHGKIVPIAADDKLMPLQQQLAVSRAEVVHLRNENARLRVILSRIPWIHHTIAQGDDRDAGN